MTDLTVLVVASAVIIVAAIISGWGIRRFGRAAAPDAHLDGLATRLMIAERARDEWRDLFLEERAQLKQLTIEPPKDTSAPAQGDPITVGEADRIAVDQRRKEQARWLAGLEPLPTADRDAVPVNRLTLPTEFTE